MGTGKSACATQGFGPTLPKGWGTRKTGTTIGARGKNKRAQARVPVPLKDADPPFRKGGAPEKAAPQSALEAKANGHRQECLCHSSQPFRRRRRLLREDATQNDKRGTGGGTKPRRTLRLCRAEKGPPQAGLFAQTV